MPDDNSLISASRFHELGKELSELKEQTYFLLNENSFLREEKEKYMLISDYAMNWEFWIDPKGQFIWISPSCVDLTGFTANEFFQDPNLIYEIVI